MLVTTYMAGMGTSWKSVVWQLLASVMLLLSGHQDLGLRAPMGAAFWFFMAMAFGISALVTADPDEPFVRCTDLRRGSLLGNLVDRALDHPALAK